MSETPDHPKPSEVDHRRSWFDELAARAQDVVSRDKFFLVLLIATLAWAPTYFVLHSLDHWYVLFVLPAEIVTLYIVALMANHDRRSEEALQRKIDALAEALAIVIEGPNQADAKKHVRELRAAVGLEDRLSTDED